jgi:NADPH:quinone reductase-like Zn-dependent oxidoreductase
MAQYALVEKRFAAHKPKGVSFLDGAALANSAPRALIGINRLNLQSTDRVLVLGGSGGMGTAIVQMLRGKGVAFIAATSTDASLVKSLGANEVIDYRAQDWSAVPAFKSTPFDVIIDCAEGASAWKRARKAGVIKSGPEGGRFLAYVINDWHIVIHNPFHMLRWTLPFVLRMICASLARSSPKYIVAIAEPVSAEIQSVLEMAAEGRLKAVLDPACPFPLTEEGVKKAFKLHEGRHAHGKVVVEID